MITPEDSDCRDTLISSCERRGCGLWTGKHTLGTMPATREDKMDSKKPGGEGWAEETAPGSRHLTEMAWKPQDNEAFPSHWGILEFSEAQFHLINIF